MPPKKRGRKPKKKVNVEITEKPIKIPKKRGRKPKGGKIVTNKIIKKEVEYVQPNIILHLKCNSNDLQQENNLFSMGNNYNPDITCPQAFNVSTNNKMTDLQFNELKKNKIIIKQETNDKFNTESNKDVDNGEGINIKNIWDKLYKLKQNLKSNNVSDKKSACFWCTFKFDNPAIYIPKEYVNKQIEAYGCFCSPQCAVAYLKNENIDNSTRWERYSLLNNIYSSIYDYKKNIKPAPNPYYTLDKFYGNLNINQYRKLLENQTLLMVVNKPMTKITPELYEDNNELPDVFNNLINENIESKGNKYRLKRKLNNNKLKHKNSIFSMIQQKVN
tara:strand:- start:2221 stop:3213 length:993 start_codon:yes stop_codon:yes gene_type:complete